MCVKSNLKLLSSGKLLSLGATVQLRCNFTLAHEQFTHSFKQFTSTCMELRIRGMCFTHEKLIQLLDEVQEWILTQLRMLVLSIMS